MKVIFTLMFLSASFGQFAQKKDKTVPVSASADSLTGAAAVTEDPMNKAAWKRTGKKGKAEFSDTTLKKERTVTYDATGNMIVSDNSDGAVSGAYPPAIEEYYTQKFPGEKFKVYWGKDKIGNKNYFINRKNETYTFDQEGNFKSVSKTRTK